MWRIFVQNQQTNKRVSSKFTTKCGFTLFSGVLSALIASQFNFIYKIKGEREKL
jgi:hypothetical protein